MQSILVPLISSAPSVPKAFDNTCLGPVGYQVPAPEFAVAAVVQECLGGYEPWSGKACVKTEAQANAEPSHPS